MTKSLLDKSKVFCEVIARDPENPDNNEFDAMIRDPNVAAEAQQPEWSHSWKKKKLTYCVIRGTEDIEERSHLQLVTNMAMTMWDIEIDLDLHPVKLIDNPKPDIRIYWKTPKQEPYFKEKPATLAFAYYPGQGDHSGIIVFNESYYWNMTGKGVPAYKIDPRYPSNSPVLIKGYNIVVVMGHEAGHMLGLTHSTRRLGKDLMDPIYNPKIKWPSESDILRIITRYKREQYRRWAHVGFLRRWFRRRMARMAIKRDNY